MRGGAGIIKKCYIILLIVFIITFVVSFEPEIFTTNNGFNKENLYRAKIVELQNITNNYKHKQLITAQFIGGPYSAKCISLSNELNGQPFEIKYKKGDLIFLGLAKEKSSSFFYIYGPIRDRWLLLLLLFFVASVVIIAGLQGIRAIISLGLVCFLVFKILVPLMIQGYEPIIVTLVIAALATVLNLFLVSGFNAKTIAAIIGTLSGVITATLLALIFGELTHLIGNSDESMQMLQYVASTHINCRGLLFSGIIIGALGAVMDIAMSISSAVIEIKDSNPKLGLCSLFTYGLKIGRDITGTMTNTLVLAYVGSSFPLLLLFNVYDTSLVHVLNMDQIAAEVIRMISGSIWLVVAIPLTAITAAFLSLN